jgi:transposase
MKDDINDEFRRDVLRIALTSGLPRSQVASDLGIALTTLNKWIRDLAKDAGGPAHDLEIARENERLRKENRLLKEERELLKSAIRFFAEPEN